MGEIPAKLSDLLDTLELVPSRQERIQVLMDIAERFRDVPERIARRPFPERHRTPACESEAYVFPEDLPDGTVKFHFAVENPQGISARAVAVILDDALSGAPLDEVVRVPREIVYKIFGNELSMGKSMGLMGMVSMVHGFAKQRLLLR